LPGIPPLEFRLGIRIHEPQPSSRWGLELAARLVDDQDRVAASLLEQPTPGFTVWDLRGVWRCSDGLRAVAGIENLFDRNYQDHLDYRSPLGVTVLEPGRNMYVGTEVTY
jgi:iron complex outermembrane receptor protein